MKSADYDLDQISESLSSMQASALKSKTDTPLEKTELILKKQLQKLIDLSGQHGMRFLSSQSIPFPFPEETRHKLAKLKDDHHLRLNNSKA